MLPSGGRQSKTHPPIRGELKVDMNENEKEVTVLVNIIEGVAKKDISIDLINPQLLEISCKRKGEEKQEKESDCLTGSRFGSMTHVIPIPKPVTVEGSTAQFRDGVLEIHLVKEIRKVSTKITID